MAARKARSRQAAIHFTHHACRVVGADPAPVLGHREPLYVHGRNPRISACWRARNALEFTTDTRSVTCACCVQWLADESEEAWQTKAREAEAKSDPTGVHASNARFWSNWADDQELAMRAWWQCCRHVNAPWPFSNQERIDAERRFSAFVLRSEFRALGSVVALFDRGVRSGVATKAAAALAALDPAHRALMTPALDHARRADEALDEAARHLAALRAHAENVSTRVLSRGLVAIGPDASEAA